MSASRVAPIPYLRVAGFKPESVATFNRNQWQASTGISGNFQPESVAGFDRNTQTTLKYVHVSRRHLLHVKSPLDLLCFESANLKALME